VPSTRGRLYHVKQRVRAFLPLGLRKVMARLIGHQPWVPGRSWWVQELLRDFSEGDPDGYHRFLWGHHLAYAETYEVGLRFGADNLHPSRRLLFADLEDCLRDLEVTPQAVDSVFEVGASLGYNLRFLEEEVFTSARTLEGCDIDSYAIERGSDYLVRAGSRIRLFVGDMGELDSLMADREYDVTICAGVLMYLQPEAAQGVVGALLRHTRIVAAFAGLADPDRDNDKLPDSLVRERDGSFIHNLDVMVARSGGRVIHRRWEGDREVGGNTVYFVFAVPAPGEAPSGAGGDS